ncbi:hypothetical protein ABZ718_37065 [Streptomyces longwoodensis]
MPLLFIEVDNCTEEAALAAQKFDQYARFFRRHFSWCDLAAVWGDDCCACRTVGA